MSATVTTISTVLANIKDFAVGLVVVAVALPFMGVRYNSGVMWAPLLMLILLGITVGSGLFLACANPFFRDAKYIVQLVLTFGIFFTPTFFVPALLAARQFVE